MSNTYQEPKTNVYTEIIRKVNYKLETIECNNNDKIKIVELVDEIIDDYENMICQNCEFYVPYETLIKTYPPNKLPEVVTQQGFGYCNVIGIFPDVSFGCRMFKQKETNSTNNTNSNQ